MASTMSFLSRTRAHFLSKAYKCPGNSFRAISTFPSLSQEPLLVQDSPPTTPLPPNPSTGSPLYQENWRNSNASIAFSQSLVPPPGYPSSHIQSLSQTVDLPSLMNVFADWMTSQQWADLKQLFEFWIRSLDRNGKPNKPDVSLFNHYLRANLMLGATAGELLDLVAQMEDYGITPNTASYNLVLKAMYEAKENVAAVKLLDRNTPLDLKHPKNCDLLVPFVTTYESLPPITYLWMLQTGKESSPDDESYDLVIGLLFSVNEIDTALKYLDLTLKSGYMVSTKVFSDCVWSCLNAGRLDTMASIIERCKAMDQNKALCPSWYLCTNMADAALQADNSKLAFYALEFLATWIARGEIARPALLLSVDEGLLVSAFGTAGRTFSAKLADASWAILRRSLRQKRAPNADSFLGKIHAHASLGNLQRAFTTLHEFENAYGNAESADELFSPFTSLHPLVLACSKDGFATLDSVYFQLENLSRANPPYKSVAALNCVILGCANIWDLDRAYQTFEAISGTFGLTPDVHSYNALMSAFGKLKKLVDAHLINRDQKAALSVIDDMVKAGFTPSKGTLKKVRRRCLRESDLESDQQVESIAKKFKFWMGSENRREMLFGLDYGTNYP
ncbi:hypothetical protein ACLOJK_002447 [Asimina triloba]